jgi:hypothetical protein
MARNIDWDQPLSKEDREWAKQRDWLHEKIQENDRVFGGGETISRVDRIAQIRTEMDQLGAELQRLEGEEAASAEYARNVAVAGDPKTGNVIVDNTGVDGQKPEGSPDAAETYDDTKKWTNAKLQAEIERRNVDRKRDGLEELSTRGNRSELVERLLEDDRELAAADDE